MCEADCREMRRNNEMGDIKKGPWKVEEDEVLLNHVRKYGPRDWSSIRPKGLLRRTEKYCHLRWVNKLRPDLKTRLKFSADEERTVIDLQAQFGNKWAKIAMYLPRRTDNDVKNFWSSGQKRLARILQTSASSSSSTKSTKTPKQIRPPAFPSLKVTEDHKEMASFVFRYDHSALPLNYVLPEQDHNSSFPHLQSDCPRLIESHDFIARLGVAGFLEDGFEETSRSVLGTAQVPVLPSFRGSRDTEEISSLIDDFPPIDLLIKSNNFLAPPNGHDCTNKLCHGFCS